MEPKADAQGNKSIFDMIGKLTDFPIESDLSNYDNDKLEKVHVQRGDFIEKYIAQKLKYLLKADSAHSTFIKMEDVHNDFILSINYFLLNQKTNPEIKKDLALNIIEKIDKVLKDESDIQIDTIIPLVSGEELLSFFQSMKEYSFPSDTKIEPNKKYTIIVESMFNLYSQIVDKANQLRKIFLLISLLNSLYKSNPEYVENYYRLFIWRYLLGNKVEKKIFEEMNLQNVNLSDYEHFVFIIASNKTLKRFKETMDLVDYMTFSNEESPGDLIKKCFSEDNELAPPKLNKPVKEKKNLKIPKDATMAKAFKNMNYLITKINQRPNYIAKLIFLDSYLNMITPKCVLGEKLKEIEEAIKAKDQEMNSMSQNLIKISEINQKLITFLKLKFPDFDISKLK